jgi:hypothetical protein
MSGTPRTDADAQPDASGPAAAFGAGLTNSGTNDWVIWSDALGSGYKGLWNATDGINWQSQVWQYLEILAQ